MIVSDREWMLECVYDSGCVGHCVVRAPLVYVLVGLCTALGRANVGREPYQIL